ncbi:hypothetical protein HAX54_012550, partial [Datura stramonium]|nr:hypothetical protein [Datura stramonium]
FCLLYALSRYVHAMGRLGASRGFLVPCLYSDLCLGRDSVPICINFPHQSEVAILRLGKDITQSQFIGLVLDGGELKCEASFINPILRSIFGLLLRVEQC